MHRIARTMLRILLLRQGPFGASGEHLSVLDPAGRGLVVRSGLVSSSRLDTDMVALEAVAPDIAGQTGVSAVAAAPCIATCGSEAVVLKSLSCVACVTHT